MPSGLLIAAGGGVLTVGRGAATLGCRARCCEPPPACDYFLRAQLCSPSSACVPTTPEVYLRCNARCQGGGSLSEAPVGTVVRVGPFGICYRLTGERFVPRPLGGEPLPAPPPGTAYLPPDAWIVRQDVLPCQASCAGCAPLQVWYRVALCACDPRAASAPPLLLTCELYHELVNLARAHGDPLGCYAYSGTWGGGGSVCFTLDGGTVLSTCPPGGEIPIAGLVVGGCCACAGCNPPCAVADIELIRQDGGTPCRSLVSRTTCCCNQETAVSRARMTRRFYDPPSSGGRLAITETTDYVLDGAGLTGLQRTEFHLEGRIVETPLSVPGVPRCERDQVYLNPGWRPELCLQDTQGFLQRDCSGGEADYRVFGLDGLARYMAVDVRGTASFEGELGPCAGCEEGGGDGGGQAEGIKGKAKAKEGQGAMGNGQWASGGCAGCGHTVGPASSPGAIERWLAE